jgi:hypothetical protein
MQHFSTIWDLKLNFSELKEFKNQLGIQEDKIMLHISCGNQCRKTLEMISKFLQVLLAKEIMLKRAIQYSLLELDTKILSKLMQHLMGIMLQLKLLNS